MSEPDFNSILDTPVEEIKAKPPLPVGTYDFRIKKLDNVKSSQKKTDGIEFACEAYAANDDVDQEMLVASGGLPRELNLTFWITADSANMVKEFLTDKCGMDGTGKTLRQLLAEAVNQSFRGVVVHGTSSKSGRTYAQIDQTLKIE
jgi:hypothetical protein